MSRELPSNVTSMARLRGKVVETGQDVEINAPRRRRRKRGWRDHVSLMDIDNMVRLELSMQEHKILFGLLAFIPEKGGGEARVTTSELADRLSMKPQNVSRGLRSLRDRHVIRTPRQSVHEVTPWLAYSGDFDSWNSEVDGWPEPIWVRGVDTETGEVK